MFFHKARQCEYFLCSVFEICHFCWRDSIVMLCDFEIICSFRLHIFNKCWNPALVIACFIDPSAHHLKILVLHVAGGDLKSWKRPNMFVEWRKGPWQERLTPEICYWKPNVQCKKSVRHSKRLKPPTQIWLPNMKHTRCSWTMTITQMPKFGWTNVQVILFHFQCLLMITPMTQWNKKKTQAKKKMKKHKI